MACPSQISTSVGTRNGPHHKCVGSSHSLGFNISTSLINYLISQTTKGNILDIFIFTKMHIYIYMYVSYWKCWEKLILGNFQKHWISSEVWSLISLTKIVRFFPFCKSFNFNVNNLVFLLSAEIILSLYAKTITRYSDLLKSVNQNFL